MHPQQLTEVDQRPTCIYTCFLTTDLDFLVLLAPQVLALQLAAQHVCAAE